MERYIQITRHFSGRTFNVQLYTGEMICGKAFNVKKREAMKVAQRMADIYRVPVVDDSRKVTL